ncbi:MAG: Rib/alpha-like domain-containing protein, partial [Eubacteriales bacterium]|nr:Rib/alpha-like domain-containing protein [Eubacteriales bacterium]
PGDKEVTVVVTYNDGSKDEVTVRIHVRNDAEAYKETNVDAKGTKEVVKGTPATTDGITFTPALPEGATVVGFAGGATVDTSVAGEKEPVNVTVKFADESTANIPVVYTVVEGEAATKEPATQDLTVNKNETPNAADAITNKDELDAKSYEFKEPVDTTTPGDKEVTVVVTYNDGSKDEVAVKVHVRNIAEGKEPKLPGTKVPVKDQSNLTDAERKDVEDAVKTANAGDPDIKDVKVNEAGDKVVVTYTDDSTDEIPVTDVTVEKTPSIAEGKEPKLPGTKVPVKDQSNLTDAEKKDVEDAVKTANAGDPDIKDVKVNEAGDKVVVTYTDDSTDEIPVTDVTVEKTPSIAEGKDPKLPGTKVPVKDQSNLTDTEKTTVEDAVKTANEGDPDIKDVKVNEAGDKVVVTYTDDSTDEIPVTDVTVEKTPSIAEGKDPKLPGTKVPVKDQSNLTDTEKTTVEDAVKTANEGDPDIKDVKVNEAGDKVVVTYTDDSTDEIPVTDVTVEKTPSIAEGKDPKLPGTKVPVKDQSNLTDAEKKNVEDAVKTANEGDPDIKGVAVSEDGKHVVVTYTDDSTDEIPIADVTVQEIPSITDGKEPKLPGTKVPVKDQSNLTDAEKKDVEDAVKTANAGDPDIKDVKVNEAGDKVVVTYTDDSTDEIPVTDVTVEKTPSIAEGKEPKLPGTKVPVKDQSNLTDAEKKDVEDAVKTANAGDPDIKDVKVNEAGDKVVVTYTDDSTDEIPVTDVTVEKTPSIAEGKEPKLPGTKVPVKDQSNLTDAEKKDVEDAVKTANAGDPDIKDVKVNEAGDKVVVTYTDDSTDEIPVTDVTEKKTSNIADDKEPKLPADKVPVKDSNHLTDAEKDAVVDAVKKSNAGDEDIEDIHMNEAGNAVIVAYKDGSTDEIPVAKLVVKKFADMPKPMPERGPMPGTGSSDTMAWMILLCAAGFILDIRRKKFMNKK